MGKLASPSTYVYEEYVSQIIDKCNGIGNYKNNFDNEDAIQYWIEIFVGEFMSLTTAWIGDLISSRKSFIL